MPYQCEADECANAVVMIITNQAEAETEAFCGPHFMTWLDAIHAMMFPAPEAPPAAPKKPRGKKTAQAAPEAPPGDPGPVADPSSGDDTDEDDARDASQDYGTPTYTTTEGAEVVGSA